MVDAEQRDTIAEDFSQVVYATLQLDPVCINYRVKMTPGELLAFAQASVGYNQYDPDYLKDLVEFVDRIVPRMNYGSDNPNTGGTQFDFFVGNENSRAVYVNVLKLAFPDGERGANNLAKKLVVWGTQHGADEASVTRNDSMWFVFRLWWD